MVFLSGCVSKRTKATKGTTTAFISIGRVTDFSVLSAEC
jgi:hypothetical protein